MLTVAAKVIRQLLVSHLQTGAEHSEGKEAARHHEALRVSRTRKLSRRLCVKYTAERSWAFTLQSVRGLSAHLTKINAAEQ